MTRCGRPGRDKMAKKQREQTGDRHGANPEDSFIPGPIAESSYIEGIRKRPGMYVGSTDFFGFINYLVCPVALLLAHRPTRVAVAARDHGFVVESEVAVPIEKTSSGRITPFEEIANRGPGHSFEATVLNALSESLTVEVHHEYRVETLKFRCGTRELHHAERGPLNRPQTTLTFILDTSIFTVADLSPTMFSSYLRRLSYLYKGTRFSIVFGNDEPTLFYAERGIVELFDSVAAPYQLLHEPIHIVADDGSLQLEAIFAYHSWKENSLWCFINNGRAVEGGTHEYGLADALDQLYQRFKSPKVPIGDRNGVVGIMSLHYPGAVWEGCIKAKIGNPELQEMVCNLVVKRAAEWLQSRREVAEQLRDIETFQFPDAWYS
jgi:DNA gyrase/topoisomerase IV subunit B